MRFIYLITKSEDGKKSYWTKQGVAFPPNKDGSVNFKLDIFPGLLFQIRDPKPETDEPNGAD